MGRFAKANLALSITMTAIATLVAPLMTPLLMKVLANQFVPIDFVTMMISVAKIVLAPIVLGLLFNKLMHGRAKWLDRAMPMLSMASITVVLTIIVASGRDALLAIGPLLFLAAILHNAIGYVLGYWGCRLIGLDEQSCRTISLEVGMQNAGLGSTLALALFVDQPAVAIPAAMYTFGCMFTGTILARGWAMVGDPAEESELASVGESS